MGQNLCDIWSVTNKKPDKNPGQFNASSRLPHTLSVYLIPNKSSAYEVSTNRLRRQCIWWLSLAFKLLTFISLCRDIHMKTYKRYENKNNYSEYSFRKSCNHQMGFCPLKLAECGLCIVNSTEIHIIHKIEGLGFVASCLYHMYLRYSVKLRIKIW